MTVTTTGLTRATGIAAAVAGTIFITVQIGHPGFDTYLSQTNEWVIRCSAKAVMTVLALAGITGMFLRYHRRFGVLGLAGYLLLTVGYLALFAVECIVAYVLPTVAHSNPAYVEDVLDAAVGGSPSGDIGHMQQLFLVTGIGYSLGGLLFGIALFRAGVLARWAALLLAYGTTSALALSVLPESFNRPFAVPTGVALIGLGVSLWRDQRSETVAAPVTAWIAEPATR